MARYHDDPDLGYGPSDDDEFGRDNSDRASLLSDDSVLPDYEHEEGEGRGKGPASTLYEACAWNQLPALRRVLDRGVTREEAMELDINGRNGLMVAIAGGFVDIIYCLHCCPLVDINHQDNEGNTAIMIAAQAGFLNILNYLMNYYPGVDTELRDCRGFTALIKASMQGRDDCMSALLMHGADINVVDSSKERTIHDWALRTGRFDTLRRLRALQGRPAAQQFCESYVVEWPALGELVARAAAPKSVGQRLKDSLTFHFPRDPQEDGVLDQMVRMTTSLHSPLVGTATRPLCPSSPPELGKRRLAVQELVAKHGSRELEESSVCHSNGSVCSAPPPLPAPMSAGGVLLATCCTSSSSASSSSSSDRKGSIISVASNKVRSFLPRSLAYRNSVFPAGCIPRIEVTTSKALPKKEKIHQHKGYLQLPVWKYKEAKVEKKKEKKRLEEEKAEQEKKDKAAKKKAAKRAKKKSKSSKRSKK